MPHRKFPSIEQLRHVVADITHAATIIGKDAQAQPIYDTTRPKPTLRFRGTTKLHGSNAGIRLEPTAEGWLLIPQSRLRDLTPDDDNLGFATWLTEDKDRLYPRLTALATAACPARDGAVTLFGEWVGKGINGKTGIGKVSNRLVLFAAVVDRPVEERADSTWCNLPALRAAAIAGGVAQEAFAEAAIYFIEDYKTWTIDIDFNDPESCLDTLERLTLEVEAVCPVAEAMGASGIGEGIVWSHQSEWGYHAFKTKGLKHKGTRSDKVASVSPEILASQQAFVDAVLTTSRLEQGQAFLVEQNLPMAVDSLGHYLKWVGQDVLKEETDTLLASGLEKKDVMKAVNHRAKDWFMDQIRAIQL